MGLSALLWLMISAKLANVAAAAGFTAEPFDVTDAFVDEKFRERVSTEEVFGVLHGQAKIPCDLTAPFPTDSPRLILFYKDNRVKPIFSFDLRSGPRGRAWRDAQSAGSRARLRMRETGRVSETGAKVVTAELSIESLQQNDKGLYRCRVDFLEAPTRNTRIRLQLITPPSLPVIKDELGLQLVERTQPLHEGEEMNLKCESEGGDPLPKLSWYKSNVIVDDVVEEVDIGFKKVVNKLRLRDLSREDDGKLLTCRASNSRRVGPLEAHVRIDIMYGPERAALVREPSFFLANTSYNVSCLISFSKPRAEIGVFLDQLELEVIDQVEDEQGTMVVVSVDIDESHDNSVLTCRADNPSISNHGVEDQWRIHVHHGPRLRVEVQETHVRSGDDVTLVCHVHARPHVEQVQWIHQGEKLTRSRSMSSTSSSSEQKFELVLPSTEASASGQYACAAANTVAEAVSEPIQLHIHDVPECALEPSSQLLSSSPGSSVELTCVMSNVATAQLEWSPNLEVVREHRQKQKVTSVVVFEMGEEERSIECSARNERGQVARKTCIFVVTPTQQQNLDALRCLALNQTYDSATISCHFDKDDKEQLRPSFFVEVREASTKRLVSNITTNRGQVQVNGLDPGQEYSARAVFGHTQSQIMHFFTLRGAEKQLAATTTEMQHESLAFYRRTLPLIAVVVAVAIVALLLAFVVVIRRRNHVARCENADNEFNEFNEDEPMATLMSSQSPDIIPVEDENVLHIRSGGLMPNFASLPRPDVGLTLLASNGNEGKRVLDALQRRAATLQRPVQRGFSDHSCTNKNDRLGKRVVFAAGNGDASCNLSGNSSDESASKGPKSILRSTRHSPRPCLLQPPPGYDDEDRNRISEDASSVV